MTMRMQHREEFEDRRPSTTIGGGVSSSAINTSVRSGSVDDNIVMTHVPNTSLSSSSSSLLRVLGIAMIVEERGAGARLVARYPTQPSMEEVIMNRGDGNHRRHGDNVVSSTLPGLTDDARKDNIEDPNDGENWDENDYSPQNDLFFTLTARQMAKLFRIKRSLCNQPMTLRVNRTIFCCHAIIMDHEENGNGAVTNVVEMRSDNSTNEPTTTSELTHFSIVVALSAPIDETVIPFSTFWDGISEDQMDLERYLLEIAASNSNESKEDNKKRKKKTAARVSSAFLAIRRVHISLARFCRALEREENRCRYVSLQSSAFFQIRNEQQKRWEEIFLMKANANAAKNLALSTIAGANSDSRPRKGRHVRSTSFGDAAAGSPLLSEAVHKLTVTPTVKQEQEKEQEILELMLATPPPERRPGLPRHHGNLVRELTKVYHALSRKEYEYPPTPISLLCEEDSVVYVNQHLAIPIEAAGLDKHQSIESSPDQKCIIQPYHTLLFPYASPSDILQTYHWSSSAAPQRLEQLLLTVNPQKPLTEIAADANLPLHVAMDLASFLVFHGTCVASLVLSSQSRLACLSTSCIPDLLLDFSQAFPGINIYLVTSFLTMRTTLGQAIAMITNVDNEEGSMLREMLVTSPTYLNRSRKVDPSVPNQAGTGTGTTNRNSADAFFISEPSNSSDDYTPLYNKASSRTTSVPSLSQDSSFIRQQQLAKDLEELVFAIAIWLMSHGVITHMQEYIVVIAAMDSTPSSVSSEPIPMHRNDPDERLFKELLDLGYLDGDRSIVSLSWRLGMDPRKLKAWGLRHSRVRVLSRIEQSTENWYQTSSD